MTDTPGELGKYHIHEELGRGGFGTVYRATDTTIDKVVALKILDPRLTRDPGFQERLRREAISAARLKHPNIVPVYEMGEAEGCSFIAMEYLSGRSLDTLLAESCLPMERALHILAQVGAALDYAHSKGLIHCDVKPSNIIVGTDEITGDSDHATLTDFGLARNGEQSSLNSSENKVIGTLAYMAPEAGPGGNRAQIDGRADVFSLGVVAHEMVTGQRPSDSANTTPPFRIENPVAPSQVNPQVPSRLDAVILKALARNREDRYSCAKEFVDALDAAYEEHQRPDKVAKELADFYAELEEAVKNKCWLPALLLAEKIRNVDRTYRAVNVLFEQARQGFKEQIDWENQQPELRSLYDKGRAALDAGEFSEAVTTFEELVAKAKQPYDDAEDKLEEARTKQAEATAAKRQHLDRLYADARLQRTTFNKIAASIRQGDPTYPDPDGILSLTDPAATSQHPILTSKPGRWTSLAILVACGLLLLAGTVQVVLPGTLAATKGVLWSGVIQLAAIVCVVGLLARLWKPWRKLQGSARWQWAIIPLAIITAGFAAIRMAAGDTPELPLAAFVTLTPSATPTITGTPTPSATATSTLPPTSTVTRTPAPTATPTLTATATASRTPTGTPVILSGDCGPYSMNVNVRSYPGSPVQTIGVSWPRAVIGQDAEGQSFLVQNADGRTGWISRNTLERCDGFLGSQHKELPVLWPPSPTPTPTRTWTPTATATSTRTATPTPTPMRVVLTLSNGVQTLRLRAGPGYDYEKMDNTLISGQEYVAIARNGAASWWQVQARSEAGWVPATFVKVSDPLGIAPTITPMPSRTSTP